MSEKFQKLLSEYNSTNNELLKRKIYDAMMNHIDNGLVRYECYDMDMYVELYKCSTTPGQRAYALNHIDEIIVDDSYQYTDEIIDNFEEFVSLRRFLHVDDVIEFDILCLKVLSFFKTRFTRANSGDETYYSAKTAKEELSQVVKIITEGDGMSELGCYYRALKAKES